jgi:endonuclease-3
MWYKQKDAKHIFPEEIWNDSHNDMVWKEIFPTRGWDLEKTILSKNCGRKTIFDKYYENKFHSKLKLVQFIYLNA